MVVSEIYRKVITSKSMKAFLQVSFFKPDKIRMFKNFFEIVLTIRRFVFLNLNSSPHNYSIFMMWVDKSHSRTYEVFEGIFKVL